MRKLERANGDIYVLMSGHVSKAPRQRQSSEHEALLSDVIDEYYMTRKCLAAKQVYDDYYLPALDELNAARVAAQQPEFEALSERSFYRRIDRIDKYDVAVARLGREKANNFYRMSKGHMPADYPLHVVEIDHAQLDLWVVDDVLMLPLGRPWITAFRDRRTGMVVGFYISFRGPSLSSIFGALRHSLYPHTGLNQTFPDLEHECVAFGQADTYVSDRGSDFLSPRYRYAIHQLHSEYEYSERRTPWHKPNIERLFLTLHRDLLETAPGKVFPGMPYNKDYNPQTQAVVRFSTLIYLIVKWAVDYHPFAKSRGKGARPYDLWMDEIADAPPPLPPNIDSLKIIAGFRQSGKLGHEGIRYKHLNYADNELEHYFHRVGNKPGTEYVVSDENLGHIMVNNVLEQRWMDIDCTRQDYAEGLSLYQHQLITNSTPHKQRNDVDQLMRKREFLQAIFAEELDRKANAGKVKVARWMGIDSTSVLAGKPKSVADLGGHGVPPAVASGGIIIPDAAFTDIPHFGWRAA
jgi:putative transposase